MVFLLEYMLAIVICLAVTIMGGYHMWGVANAETTVESQDHEQYRKIARSRGDVSAIAFPKVS